MPNGPMQEIRFAVVLYGGVSLAIYINGVVQELLRLVRSTSDIGSDQGSEGVYRQLGRLLDPAIPPTQATPATQHDPIKTKFKIDIISGTSAGGINGIFLAKALASEGRLNQLQDLWFKEAGIDDLLNDRKSYAGLPVTAEGAPQSLLNSRRMYVKLLDAFDGMDDGAPSRDRHGSRLADELDLFATTTDIEGVPVPIRLLDNVVYERRYRNVFRLRFIPNERDDFQPDNNPFLAFAARCTSSFPFAFEPMQLCDIDEILRRKSSYSAKRYCFSGSSRWQKFYTNYLQDAFGGATEFSRRSFGDGGYLNNAPFSYAVDTLLKRQADLPVSRKLLYVEPSPAHPEEQPARTGRPNAIENGLAALITIPGYQTIRNDLSRVLQRNREAARINTTLNEIQRHIQEALPPHAGPLVEIAPPEPALQGYYQLRASDVTDRFATILARTLWIDEESILFTALRSLIRAWRERRYEIDPREQTPAPVPAGGGNTLDVFLGKFDLPYRIRRLRFVLRKLDTLYALQLDPGHPAYRDALETRAFGLGLEQDPNPPNVPAQDLTEVRRPIARACALMQATLNRLLEVRDPPDTDTPDQLAPSDDDARVILQHALGANARELLLPVLCEIAGVSPDAQDPQARLTTQPLHRRARESRLTDLALDRRAAERINADGTAALRDRLESLENTLAFRLRELFEAMHGNAETAFGGGDAGRIARRYYQRFDLFDCVQFPMTFGTDIGEPDSIDIIRVCPEDAPALVSDPQQRRTKLKGLAIAHFGAFLDEDWRISDLLWGRLDGAERIITALLPLEESATLRERLIDEAHAAILAEFDARPRLGQMALKSCASLAPQLAQQLIDGIAPPAAVAARQTQTDFMSLWQRVVPAEPDRVMLMRALSRGTTITGRMLDGIAQAPQLKAPAKWLTTAGRALWALVEISVPRHWATLLGRYWQSLLLLISIIMILAGLLSSQPAVSGFGWALLAFAVFLMVVRTLLWEFMRRGRVRGVLRVVIAVFAAVILFAAGLQLYQWGGSAWQKVQAFTCEKLGSCTGNAKSQVDSPANRVAPQPTTRDLT